MLYSTIFALNSRFAYCVGSLYLLINDRCQLKTLAKTRRIQTLVKLQPRQTRRLLNCRILVARFNGSGPPIALVPRNRSEAEIVISHSAPLLRREPDSACSSSSIM